MENNQAIEVYDARAAKFLGLDANFKEITYWFGESFKPYAKAQNKKNRRKTKKILANDIRPIGR